jgi:GNAT superfamily N-acetyltransferase
MQTLYSLKDYKETFKFEREHPKPLRWDDKYKLWMLEQNDKCQGLWLRDKTHGIIAEIIVSWESSNVLHGESITVLPEFQKKGYGKHLVEEMLDWGENMGYKHFIGEARKISSWSLFEKLGAKPILEYENWNDSGENYMFFKMMI